MGRQSHLRDRPARRTPDANSPRRLKLRQPYLEPILLVLVGPRWLSPRLEDPEDYVRREIEHGLTADRVRVVPLLLDGAQMPRADELPRSLAELPSLQAFGLADDTWDTDVEKLRASLQEDIWRQPRVTEWREGAKERARDLLAGGRRASGNLRSVRAFDDPDADLDELARLLCAFYQQEKLEAQVLDAPRSVLVQARTRGVRSVAGMSVSLTVCLRHEDAKLLVEIGPGRWRGKAVATAMSPWIPPLLLTAGYGAARQRALPKKTYRFISAYLEGLVPKS